MIWLGVDYDEVTCPRCAGKSPADVRDPAWCAECFGAGVVWHRVGGGRAPDAPIDPVTVSPDPAPHEGGPGRGDASRPIGRLPADVAAWLRTATWSSFAMSLVAQLDAGRALSDRQIAAAANMHAKAAAKAAAPPAATGLDLSGLPGGRYAVPGGDRLKLEVEHGEGTWAGWVFVSDAAVYGAGARYGKQRPGGRYEGDCAEALAVILADPLAASKAYGRLVRRCGVCGRPLEDEVSVREGIGPVCKGRFG